jgi:hypothetical protein
VTERLKVLVLKTSVGRPTVGSNPTLSAIISFVDMNKFIGIFSSSKFVLACGIANSFFAATSIVDSEWFMFTLHGVISYICLDSYYNRKDGAK